MSDSEEENERDEHSMDSNQFREYLEEFYEDHFATSPQILAVFADNVQRLQDLIESGKSVNIKNGIGNTPLHIAVLKQKVKAFDFLLTVDGVEIDAKNFDGETPLFLALSLNNEYFALELINKGADVNATCASEWAPLHCAVSLGLKVSQILIDKGANINVYNSSEKTPLYVACSNSNCEMIHMLLCYGADVSIPSFDGILPFDLVLSKCPEALHEIFFNYVFDQDKVPVNLRTLTEAMKAQSPVFIKIIEKTCKVLYDENDLSYLSWSLPYIDNNLFKVFLDNFEEVVKDMFLFCNSLKDSMIKTDCNNNFVDFLYLLCERGLISTAVENYHNESYLIRQLINLKTSEDILTKLVCCLLSYGVNIVSDDLNTVYNNFGFCELFKIMLHMDITDYSAIVVMPTLIYDVNFTDKCLATPENFVSLKALQTLMKFFALPKLKEYCLSSFSDNKRVMDQIKNVKTVPSLLELGRNAARKYIIQKYNIKKSVHFFTVLKWLPISDVYKAILSYEKEVYRI